MALEGWALSMCYNEGFNKKQRETELIYKHLSIK